MLQRSEAVVVTKGEKGASVMLKERHDRRARRPALGDRQSHRRR